MLSEVIKNINLGEIVLFKDKEIFEVSLILEFLVKFNVIVDVLELEVLNI